jgi:hypothetical protein
MSTGTGLQSWFDRGQNRESGGQESEQTEYGTADRETTGSGPAT